MKEQKQDMKLPKLDDLFTTQEERDYAVAEKVQEIDISKISNFPDHPFKVNDDEKMQDMYLRGKCLLKLFVSVEIIISKDAIINKFECEDDE